MEWILEADPVVVRVILMGMIVAGSWAFFFLNGKTADNHERVRLLRSRLDSHERECRERYEESALSQGQILTTIDQISTTLAKIDQRTQKTHDDVTDLKARGK